MPVLELKGHTEKVHRCCYVTTAHSSEQLIVSNVDMLDFGDFN